MNVVLLEVYKRCFREGTYHSQTYYTNKLKVTHRVQADAVAVFCDRMTAFKRHCGEEHKRGWNVVRRFSYFWGGEAGQTGGKTTP